MNTQNTNAPNPMIKTMMIFIIMLIIGSTLIYFGSRNDAVSVAKSLKTGVLTADKVNIAFENVGGKLIKKHVEESQVVNKGDILLMLDDADNRIALDQLNAVINGQDALIRSETAAIEIAINETNLAEITAWRKIEEIEALLSAAKANYTLAEIDFNRADKLRGSGSISQSLYDNAKSALVSAESSVIQAERQLATATIGATEEEIDQLLETKKAEGMTLLSIKNAREAIENRKNTLDQLNAALAQSKAEFAQLQLNQSRLVLKAPESGKILNILYEEGEMISPNAPAIILETDRKYVDIYVNEMMVPRYREGSEVTAKVLALGKEVKGKVRFATAAPSFADLRTTREQGQADLTAYQVRIYLNPFAELLTGMTVEVNDETHR